MTQTIAPTTKRWGPAKCIESKALARSARKRLHAWPGSYRMIKALSTLNEADMATVRTLSADRLIRELRIIDRVCCAANFAVDPHENLPGLVSFVD